MSFELLLVLHAVLMIRPAELIETLQPFRLYQTVILCCLAVSASGILHQVSRSALARQPLTLCVLGLLVAVVCSHLRHGSIYDARMGGYEFLKLVLFYLLLVYHLRDAGNYRRFISWFVLFALFATSLSLLQFYGYINFPALAAFDQREIDQQTGEIIIIRRLCSAGIFNDPNDVCLMFVLGIVMCFYKFNSPQGGCIRWLWLVPIGLFLVAFIETKSRGGFLALVAASGVLCLHNLGWKRTMFLAILGLPVLAVAIGGRMTDIDIHDGTGQHRIQLWREALGMLREYPIFGVGQGVLTEYTRLVAHNSYIHAFAELGILGGSFFTCLTFLAIVQLHALRRYDLEIRDPEMRRFRPYLLAIVFGFCTGIGTLSRVYFVPTYLVFGMVAGMLLQGRSSQPIDCGWQLNLKSFGKLACVSMVFLIALEVGSRLLVRWEG